MAFYDIKYVRYDTPLEDVESAVREEMEGPGQLLGYRAVQQKLREQHNLAVRNFSRIDLKISPNASAWPICFGGKFSLNLAEIQACPCFQRAFPVIVA